MQMAEQEPSRSATNALMLAFEHAGRAKQSRQLLEEMARVGNLVE